MLDGLTLDQLRVFAVIAETGSFSAAARKLRRAQSAVSYAVAGLETQLGLQLFDRSTRTPKLTAEGQALLPDVQAALGRVEQLKLRASELSKVEGELSLAVSVVYPRAGLVAVLGQLAERFPAVRLRLHVEEVSGALDLVLRGICQLGVTGSMSLALGQDEGLERRSIGAIGIVAVAPPGHPLTQRSEPLSIAELQDQRQLVPTSRALPRYLNVLASDVWEVADLPTRHAMLLSGQGWGTVPEHLVRADLAAGRLVRLQLAPRPDEAMRVQLFAVYPTGRPPGPTGEWLIERLASELQAGSGS